MVAVQPEPDELTTEELYRHFLTSRRREFDPKEIRLSEVGQCPRRQTLRILGYDADPFSETQYSRFFVGDENEERMRKLWAAKYPRQVRQQIEVRSPFGVGHLDAWVAPRRRVMEFKSVREEAAERLPIQAHIDQLMVYLHYWGVEHGCNLGHLVYRIVDTGIIQTHLVRYDAAEAAGLVARLQAVADAARFGEPLLIPEGYTAAAYPCSWFTRRGRVFCGYLRHCFGEAVEEAGGKFVDAQDMAADLAAFLELNDKWEAAKATADSLETAVKAGRSLYAELMDQHGADIIRANGVYVKRTIIKDSFHYDVKQALEDNAVAPATLEPYKRTKTGGTRWTVRAEKAAKVKEVA